MTAIPSRAALLPILSAAGCGLSALVLGWSAWSFQSTSMGILGAACLLEIPASLSLHKRVKEGLGNAGLERERIILRVNGAIQRLLALGLAVLSVLALTEAGSTQTQPWLPGMALLPAGIQGLLWVAKRPLGSLHPSLDLDARRSRALLESGLLLVLGMVAWRWFPWAEGACGLLLALRLFLLGQFLAKTTTLAPASCGSCGSCGCG